MQAGAPAKRPSKRMKAGSASTHRAPKRLKQSERSSQADAGLQDSTDIEDIATFAVSEVQQIRQDLLAWYDEHHRILPWRRNAHSTKQPAADDKYKCADMEMPQQHFAYHVWVCEVMSQQTQVPRVAEYFSRWVAKWPTLQDFAASTQDEVNDMWAGLGYYRRARLLLAGAQHIQSNLSGQMPLTAQELQKIPGIGPYTSSAIASIAGLQRVAVVDANVVRVLARLRRLGADQKSSSTIKLNAVLADSLVDPNRPGCFNQAMMELGACICTVHQPPACTQCPIRIHCKAYGDLQEYISQGGQISDIEAPLVSQYPSKVTKAPKREESVAVTVVQLLAPDANTSAAVDSQYLLVQRPEKGLLAGLWEFPSCLVQGDAADDKTAQQAAVDRCLAGWQELPSLQSLDSLQLIKRVHLGSLVHIFSHIQQTMHVQLLVLQGLIPSANHGHAQLQWVSGTGVTEMGLSSGVKKIWKKVSVYNDANAKSPKSSNKWKQQKLKL